MPEPAHCLSSLFVLNYGLLHAEQSMIMTIVVVVVVVVVVVGA